MPSSLRLAAGVCGLAAVFLGFGAAWVSGYAVMPADDVTREEGLALTAAYLGAIALLAALAIACRRAKPGTWQATRVLALVGLVLGGLLVLLAAIGFVVVIVLELHPPVPILAADPMPGGLLFVPSLLAYTALSRPEAQRWFGLPPQAAPVV